MITDTRIVPCFFCGATFTYSVEMPREAVRQWIDDHARSHA